MKSLFSFQFYDAN